MACDTSSSIFVASTSKKDLPVTGIFSGKASSAEPLFYLGVTTRKVVDGDGSASLFVETEKDQARKAVALKHQQQHEERRRLVEEVPREDIVEYNFFEPLSVDVFTRRKAGEYLFSSVSSLAIKCMDFFSP